MSETPRVGLALCGSFCTFDKALAAAAALREKYDLTALMSENAASTDTRFGKAADFIALLEELTGKRVMRTITEAERVGPGRLFDALAVAPCTGNTLSKVANGITDTSVTMAVKSQFRAESPVVLAISTNDGLSGSAASLAAMLNRRGCYLVPFGQDAPLAKPRSLVADFTRLDQTIEAALQGRQLQPILL